MHKTLFLFLLILLNSIFSFAQNDEIFNKEKIMLKLKVENRYLLKGNTINNAAFNDIISGLKNTDFKQVFPNKLPLRQQLNKYGDSLVDLSLWCALTFKNNDNPKLISDLKSIGIFKYVEYRPINTLFYTPSDPKIGFQYYLDNIKAYDAWDIEKGDTNVVVAITDTGIDKLQEDLIDGIKYNYNDTLDGMDNDNDGFIDNFCGWDVANNDNNVQWGTIGHGTFVSGFVSAVPDNNIGIAGVGFNTKVLPVRIDNNDGSLSADYEGIVYAADHGAAIINCSWGGQGGENFGRDVVNYATYNMGALIVAACGNSNNPIWFYPASYENVLSCAATDTFDVRWDQSSYGTTVDLSAPGTFVYSTWVNNGYFSSHGTSFSAPIIAGGAALVKAHFPDLTNIQIAEQLRVTADIIDTISANSSTIGMMGAGRLNIYKALTDTLKPAIRFKNQNLVISNDTLYISGDFINYLTKSSAILSAKLYSPSPYLSPIFDSINLGILTTFGTISNNSLPIKFKISSSVPIGAFADIQLNYSDTAYSGFEWIRVYFNQQAAKLDTNNITTSINSLGTIGYNDLGKMIGSGFTYKNGRNLLSWGGLLIATSNSKVSDNIYGAMGVDTDFVALSAVHKISSAPADQKFLSLYNDLNAGFSKNNIQVNQFSYAFANEALKDVVFIEFNIINTNPFVLDNINVAMYADWDIGLSYKNRAKFNTDQNLAYTWPSEGGTYASVQLMSTTTANCYNFNNNGTNGSINIYDGFLNFEKWDAMQTPRLNAGVLDQGADVSSMLNTGAHSLNANDTLTITFALAAGSNKNEIINTAAAANYWFFNTASTGNLKQGLGIKLLQNIPNPASLYTEISFVLNKSKNVRLEIYSIDGRLIETIVSKKLTSGNHNYKVNLHNYKAGIYTYKLSTNNGSISRKMIIK